MIGFHMTRKVFLKKPNLLKVYKRTCNNDHTFVEIYGDPNLLARFLAPIQKPKIMELFLNQKKQKKHKLWDSICKKTLSCFVPKV